MKKIMKVVFAVAVVAIAGYGVYTNQKTDIMSDVMLANVEALANGELSETRCEASWEKECCVCGNVHHKFAHVKAGNEGQGCNTKKCLHSY